MRALAALLAVALLLGACGRYGKPVRAPEAAPPPAPAAPDTAADESCEEERKP